MEGEDQGKGAGESLKAQDRELEMDSRTLYMMPRQWAGTINIIC